MNPEGVPLSEVLTHRKEFIMIKEAEFYKRVRIKLHRQGMVIRDEVKGHEIKTKRQQVCRANQFLVAEIDAKVGGYGIVPEKLAGAIVSSHYFLFDIDLQKVDLKYFKLCIETQEFFSQIKAEGSTNYASIRPKDVLALKIPLPSLPEQKKIAEKLTKIKESKAEFNALQEEKLTLIVKLRQSILQSAVQGTLVHQDPQDEPASELLKKIKAEKEKLIKEGKLKKQKPLLYINEEEKPYALPNGWEWVRLGEIGRIVGGGTPSTAEPGFFTEKGIPWLTPADLYNLKEKYISKGRRDITEMGLRNSSVQLMPEGTVLFSSRAPIGYVAISKNEITTNQGFKSCIPFMGVISDYIYYYFKATREQINKDASGTTFNEVSGEDVKNLPFPLPPLAEQKRIVEKVDKLMAYCDELEKQVTENQVNNERLISNLLV